MIFFKVVPRPLGMLKQSFLGRFQPVVARFRPPKMAKCLGNRRFWGGKQVKKGSKMFTALHLHDGNANWQNVFNNHNAAAGCHVDDCRFERGATYIFHFEPPCIMQWDGKEYELLHTTLYGFDASMQHELPCGGHYSLSSRAWV